MALLWADSFEHQTNTRGYVVTGLVGNDQPPDYVTGRHGQAVRCGNYTGIGNGGAYLEGAISSSSDTFIMGFAFKATSDDSGDSLSTILTTTNFTVCAAVPHTANGWKLVNSSGDLTSYGGPVFNLNTWYWVEWKIVVGVTGSAELRVNGVTVSSATGIDTTYTGTVNRVRVGGVYEKSWTAYDDFVVMDGTGTACNDFIGDSWVQAMPPNADGAVTQLNGSDGDQVDNYDLVNETVPSPTDYVGSSISGDQDYYGVTDLAGGVTWYVHGAHVWGLIGKETGWNAYGRLKALDGVGSTQYDTIVGLSTSYAYQHFTMTTTPSGSTWTPGRWADVQLGFEVRDSTTP